MTGMFFVFDSDNKIFANAAKTASSGNSPDNSSQSCKAPQFWAGYHDTILVFNRSEQHRPNRENKGSIQKQAAVRSTSTRGFFRAVRILSQDFFSGKPSAAIIVLPTLISHSVPVGLIIMVKKGACSHAPFTSKTITWPTKLGILRRYRHDSRPRIHSCTRMCFSHC